MRLKFCLFEVDFDVLNGIDVVGERKRKMKERIGEGELRCDSKEGDNEKRGKKLLAEKKGEAGMKIKPTKRWKPRISKMVGVIY